MKGYQPKMKRLAGDLVPHPIGTAVSASPSTNVEPDRVWLSLGRKYRVAKYESLSVDIGVSASVEPGESRSGTLKRVFRELLEEYGDIVDVMRDREGL